MAGLTLLQNIFILLCEGGSGGNLEEGAQCGPFEVIKSWKVRWAGHVARMGGMRNIYKASVGKPEGKRELGRPRRR
jgi:hypothetical protein